ncbi:3-phosphoshikimate 1-carboxyvinyltransferase [Pustulibacterium marinum]|uniref:3-phosphoshikimate 1-carboxyvinyltransferase n=1 Tax=Pustulibacterium marinum TaxID=1224947 RepID=A0A1I7GNA2_9FLAO|nr:3-phosphoshikimate 1-carboxyvinyltransferase [Pustulibacterium marinum]SFU49746.1 3-phosphoshikimate 1-carboxyvinyltransferase [Pustulibacterium marinum]
MKVSVQATKQFFQNEVNITGSKSETNRLLLLQALYPHIQIENISNSDDAAVMQKGLASTEELVDIHHAGTAMRFLTAYFAVQEGKETLLTGSARMQERPVKVLVEALKNLGADISYDKNEGYPPLRISGKKLTNDKVTLPADVSSQYISALLLIASKLENGLELTLEGKITSIPYIQMTLALLNEIGIGTKFENNTIKVFSTKISEEPKTLVVESDWSSASYYYSIIALSEVGSQIKISSYKENSLQGDSHLAILYQKMGVDTIFENNTAILTKNSHEPTNISFDLTKTPDIAQTIAVTCFGLGIGCSLSGLHTLKIKETDRLEALKVELTKFGADIRVTDKELFLEPSSIIRENIAIDTYNDHRMAMAFAPLALKVPILVNDAMVVSKSYPDFWEDLKKLAFEVKEL